ncbi:MAG TPA: DUF308 domain-containing protein [Bradyrhizobium sp.]|nr:DUF308 domain-containing protein [Bradyrhizobium sp.]
MMIGLLVAGIVAIVAGALAIAYGFMLELSFGNTLILAGAFGACSGMIVLAQTLVVYELRNLGRKLGPRMAGDARSRPATAEEGLAPPRDLAGEAETPLPGGSAPPWRDEPDPRDRMRPEPAVAPPEMAEPTPPPSRRRNLMFSSNVRKDRAQQPGESADQPDLPEAADAPPASFEDTWPRAERPPPRPSELMAQRRAARAGLAEGKAGAAAPERPAPPPMPRDEPPPSAGVTVIKSGVVDGMAYSLYSDGSIEAQMPEGMMRFASIDELRAHLDQRA